MSTAILWPILAHVGLVFFLYAWLSFARIRAVRAGRVQSGFFEFGRDEPPDIARITRNLGNQFELPVGVGGAGRRVRLRVPCRAGDPYRRADLDG